jgi:sugar phosphate isomerase/epimerase
MRIGPDHTHHLTYCTNIHPGESWEDVRAQLAEHLPALKAELSPDAPFGIGLRLSNRAAEGLDAEGRLAAFRDWLDAEGAYVFTINGFPYGDFHGTEVKDRVYAPDWQTRERVAYTDRLARILAGLLPEGVEGSISTVPVSYGPWFEDAEAADRARRVASRRLADAAATLVEIERSTGRRIHLGLEPEPDGLVENTGEMIDYFTDWLVPVGRRRLGRVLGERASAAEALLRRHVGVCYDTCHFALQYETPLHTLSRFAWAGIRVGKIQLSAALRAVLPADPVARRALRARLGAFAESTYLHQVVERRPDGRLRRYRDLFGALPKLEGADGEEWRVHFHVPLFLEAYQTLHSTRSTIGDTLRVLAATGCEHLEIETYTWEVLPAGLQADVRTSIAREYRWVLDQYRAAGLGAPAQQPAATSRVRHNA